MSTLLRARKQEREQLIELLDAPFLTVDDAAAAVWRLVAGHVLARDWFVAVSADTELWVNGPWGSREQATAALATITLPVGGNGGTVYIRKLMTTAAEYEQLMLGDADA